jgi:hypothetical protein
VDAEKLGLITDVAFASRADKILSFLNSMSLNSTLPYSQYSSDGGSAATTAPTDGADYGRLLIAEYVLKQQLLQLRLTSQAAQVTTVVSRVNNSYFAGNLAGDLYGYYASLGFMLWGLIPSTVSSAQTQFDNLIANGSYVQPSDMYGVSGIPANTRIDGEPFADAILEVGNLPQITGLPSWNDFLHLARLVYDAQEGRSNATGKPEFWTEGGLDFQPGFDYQWVEWITGASWAVLDAHLNPVTDSRLPVAFFKLAFAYNALYNTPYTQNTLNNYANALEASNGFMEGVYANGAYDTNLQVQTNELILTSAASIIPAQTVSTTDSPLATTSIVATEGSASGTGSTSASAATGLLSFGGFAWEAVIITAILIGLSALLMMRARRKRNRPAGDITR